MSVHQRSESRSNLCKGTYVGAKDIVADIDVDEEGYFTYKGVQVMVTFKYLSRGIYGEVFRASFSLGGETHHFAIKRGFHGEAFDEATYIEEHTASVTCPGVISMKVRKYRGAIDDPYDRRPKTIAIMPLADGDLVQHAGTFTHEQATQVVEVIRQALLCFHANGDYYYEIKPDNILINCHGGVSTFFLGDMGSIVPDENGEYIATYPPPEFPSGIVEDTTHALKHYSYMLACLYCSLIAGRSPPPYNGVKSVSMNRERFARMLKELGDKTLARLRIRVHEGDVPDHVALVYKVSDLLYDHKQLDKYLDYITPINDPEWPAANIEIDDEYHGMLRVLDDGDMFQVRKNYYWGIFSNPELILEPGKRLHFSRHNSSGPGREYFDSHLIEYVPSGEKGLERQMS